MVTIRITDWNKKPGWADFSSYHPHDLERRLVRLTGKPRGEVKRLVRRLRNRECIALHLANVADSFSAYTLCSFLESVGASVQIEDS